MSVVVSKIFNKTNILFYSIYRGHFPGILFGGYCPGILPGGYCLDPIVKGIFPRLKTSSVQSVVID